MTDWHDIALPTGSPSQGFLGLHCNFRLPESKSQALASPRQVEAVLHFFEVNFGDLSDDQAHTLLSCREYARLAARSIFGKYPEIFQRLMARALASYILQDSEIVEFSLRWNDSNFRRGTGSPRVQGTPYFEDLRKFSEYLEGMVELEGWTKSQLRDLK